MLSKCIMSKYAQDYDNIMTILICVELFGNGLIP